jgi:Cu+-exporting ATPase
LRPDRAIKREAGGDRVVALSEVAVGDLLVVKPGARLAVDGAVVEGHGAVDEAHLTGESMPVEKEPGAKVMAGAINGATLLLVRTERIGAETMLGRMVRLVEDAQANKPSVQKLADRISAVFVPVVLGLAVVTMAGWFAAGATAEAAILNAVSVLVIACPCALGLATPAAIMAGTGVAARHGILIRDTDILARAKSIGAVVFDKTGTLTEGRPRLVEWRGGICRAKAWKAMSADVSCSWEVPRSWPGRGWTRACLRPTRFG